MNSNSKTQEFDLINKLWSNKIKRDQLNKISGGGKCGHDKIVIED